MIMMMTAKLLLQRAPELEDLKYEQEDEYNTFIALQKKSPKDLDDFCNTEVDDEDLHMHFQVPSRIIQLRSAIRYLAAGDPEHFQSIKDSYESRHAQDFDDHVASRSDDSDRMVCSENFQDYVRLTVKKYLETNVADVMAHILPAFEAVVPEATRLSMQPHELSTMIIGDDDVDVVRWRELCSGDYGADPVVMWFWEHMETCPAEERLKVLQWTTGYNRLPYHTSDKYNIRRDRDPAHANSHLPSTATCDGLGQLVLPTYSSKSILVEKLTLAIQELHFYDK